MEYACLGKYENHYIDVGLGGGRAGFKGGPTWRALKHHWNKSEIRCQLTQTSGSDYLSNCRSVN